MQGMQYLLSEDEFRALVPKDEVAQRDHALAAARQELLNLAGFACIHDKAPAEGLRSSSYCSQCPCSPLGNGKDFDTWSKICWLQKNYPQ